jgi:PTS system nitrogen regulatory IIA component
MNAQILTVADLIPPAHAAAGMRAADKQALLRQLAGLAAPATGSDQASLAVALAAREALGSTGVGLGLALPHARLTTLASPLAWLVRLARPVAYEAVDGAPVDLLVMLLSPERDTAGHLAALAAISRRLRQPGVAAAIRAAPDAPAMRTALIG